MHVYLYLHKFMVLWSLTYYYKTYKYIQMVRKYDDRDILFMRERRQEAGALQEGHSLCATGLGAKDKIPNELT